MSPDDRHSHALEVELIKDPDERARREAKNVLQQFDRAIELIESSIQPERPFKLRPSAILSLNRYALEGISSYAGIYRPAGIAIGGSKHTPPGAHLVPECVEELCEYVNTNWNRTPLHLAAYVMWRLNWIHPFVDGNGRTTRIVSFVVLSIRLGYRVPGSPTVPEQIAADKKPYYAALERADAVFEAENRIDVSEMEALLSTLLAKQLASVLRAAGSNPSHQGS
jgi:Fic family protein